MAEKYPAGKVQARGHIYNSFVDTIGNTPLVRLPNLSAFYDVKADILAKLEFFNPLSSVKDRLALALIEDGEKSGKITKDTIIIEPTSGNTGIGLAFICAARGYRLILTMPESMSYERRKLLKMFGAELVLTPKDDGIKGTIDAANALLKKHAPNGYMPQQFQNPANPEIHRKTTAEEIWQDTDGNVDMLICGIGTGGTFTGLSSELKSRNPNMKAVVVEPVDSAVLSGHDAGPHKIQGIGAGFIPDIMDMGLVDEIITVTNDQAYAMTRKTIEIEGLPVGISSGAALHAAIEIGKRDDMAGKQIVVIIPSCAERYLSTPLFKDLEI